MPGKGKGKGRGRKPGVTWSVTAVPEGTAAEAEAAVRRAQRLVAEWIRRGAEAQQAGVQQVGVQQAGVQQVGADG